MYKKTQFFVLLFSLFLYFTACSSLPTKEVEQARWELDRAKANQAEDLANQEYEEAMKLYTEAEKNMQAKEGNKAKENSLGSLEKSRRALILAKDRRALNQIKKVENLLEDCKKLTIKDLEFNPDILQAAENKLEFIKKIRPAEEKLKEAKKDYQDGKALVGAIEAKIRTPEKIAELDSYITFMDGAYDKAVEAEKMLQQEIDALKKVAEEEAARAYRMSTLYSSITKGEELVALLNNDPFVKEFYNEEKEEHIKRFQALKRAVKEKNEEEIENNKDGYEKLQAFFNRMRDEKQLLTGVYSAVSDKVLKKIRGFYFKEAESYLERARRLKEEVERFYRRDRKINMKTNTTENISLQNLPYSFITQDKSKKTPEEVLLDQLNSLYQDAEAAFEKEEYGESIEKAKQAIELAEKMLLLKKQMEEAANKKKKKTGEEEQDISSLSFKMEFKKYKVRVKDCLWRIAMRKDIYSNAALWPLIWYANKEIIPDPNLIEPDTELQIPVFKKVVQ